MVVGTDVEGPMPLGINSGMVVTLVVGMGPPEEGSEPATLCAVTRSPLGPKPVGPVEGIPVMIGGMDVSPLLTIPP